LNGITKVSDPIIVGLSVQSHAYPVKPDTRYPTGDAAGRVTLVENTNTFMYGDLFFKYIIYSLNMCHS